MTFFHNLKLANKLLASFAALLLLSASVGLFALLQLDLVNQTATDLTRQSLPAARALQDMKYQLQRHRAQLTQHLLAATPAEAETYEKTMPVLWDAVNRQHAGYAAFAKTPEEQQLLADIATDLKAYATHAAQILQLSREVQSEQAAYQLRGDSLKVTLAIQSKLEALDKINEARTESINARGDELFEAARWWIIGLLTGSVLLGFALALGIARAVSRPLQNAVKLAQQVAAGNLASRIEVHSRDETGQLLQALQDMNASLQRIVGQVRQGTDSMATASSQIASGNQDLSARTEEQASSLEQTAASMEELTATVKQNAANAQQANQLASAASQVAVRGGAAVSQVVQTMSDINASSRRIVDIIGVIDSIAFQTNILALNAAVEAARAGDQGRGFAVVASEVRTLAQRSASAAKEIKQLIDASVTKVEEGNGQVEQAGRTMEEIVTSVRRVTDIMGEITAASHEQTTGIEQVNQAIIQMDQMTQQNAALVEEAAAATDALQGQAAALSKVVSVFDLGQAAALAAAPANAPLAPAPKAAPARPAAAAAPAPGVAAAPMVAAPPARAVKPRPSQAPGSDGDWESF
ncbi:methyl-accepting chemotaxis protein [Comamonas endophytica]|uniref:Methyl-accepting chemotaxis protein n=1 Tax=Comamonas endophytica TaxID=2949090 RepID=A0ABY6G937_9BURK|nr:MULTISPECIES: methyl-accepting chemotaxis protein [unclassified Acidovorax]MCD2511681.1 methyl-accepting chemotaxis protein [Acidovorax sp. D4N7]UYG51411.1 methyl-accepting chemotaxis protein [Acidovorax sp. 5MLIR]